MRITFLAIFLALVATCATADVIDNVVNNLPDGWNDSEAGIIIMPKTASAEDVLPKIFQKVGGVNLGQITNFTVLATRQVRIPCFRFPNSPAYSYTAVLVQPSQGWKVVVVLLRNFDVYTSKAWLSAVFEANVEDTWKEIKIDSFSFSIPLSFKRTDMQGIDSIVGEYVSDGIDLGFDYGAYSHGFGVWPKDTKFEDVKINGALAKIGTLVRENRKDFPYAIKINFKSEGLTMYAWCKSEKEVALARKIFGTIVFNTE